MAYPSDFKSCVFALQNLCFWVAKPMLLGCKTYAFEGQNLCFCKPVCKLLKTRRLPLGC